MARPGWQRTPIGLEEWTQAVRASPDMELHQAVDGEFTALLRGSRRRRLTWHEGYLAAHHTNPRMAVAVFALAEQLGADVYSERRHRYADLQDWERRVGVAPSRTDRLRGLALAPALATTRSTGWLAWLMVAVGVAFAIMSDGA